MPNLENLKKQAKQYLRWHRERYYPVAAEIRGSLPKFQHLDDNQILEASFQLSDAQELIARQMGFDGWEALQSGATTMTSPFEHSILAPVLTSTSAHLFVSDVTSSCRFFTEKLGFTVDFVYGEPPFYGQLVRDKAQIALRLVCEPVFVGNIREREDLLSASITVNSAGEIKKLFLDFQQAGVTFHQSLKRQPWGARDFIVRDPDGNLIQFAGPAD